LLDGSKVGILGKRSTGERTEIVHLSILALRSQAALLASTVVSVVFVEVVVLLIGRPSSPTDRLPPKPTEQSIGGFFVLDSGGTGASCTGMSQSD
jgi:hypothetical protein